MNANSNDTPKQAKARKPRPKLERIVRILEHPGSDDAQGWFAISISLTTTTRKTTRTETTVYLVREIPAGGMGRGCCGFEVEKLSAELQPTGDVYHVLLDDRDGNNACDCKGGEHHGRCKHRESIQALLKAGQLKPRFRSSGDMAANAPDEYEQHMRAVTADEYPDEPPQLPHWSPDDDGPDAAA